ncbi:SMP-30/gluconolactonase/LRE family protein [Candidatus Hydrogenedentota bacterium]
MNVRAVVLVLTLVMCMSCATTENVGNDGPIIAPGAKVELVKTGFKFLEGPAADREGNLYFVDPPNSKLYKHSLNGEVTLVRDKTNMANGHYFDKNGNLVACETMKRRIISTKPDGEISVVADSYRGKKFNNTNDLWIDPEGGIYFTDPRYMKKAGPMEQDGEHVYYVTPDGRNVIRVADDLERPNGIIGTPDGKRLYIADHKGRKTYVYSICSDGTLKDKKLFANQGSDGLTMDERGNVYFTSGNVTVYDPNGNLIKTVEVPEAPANVAFGGKDRKTLFICARTSLYSLRMNVRGHKTVIER